MSASSRRPLKPSPRKPNPHKLGLLGERAAARYLQRRGYTILAGGYRVRCGEIDLIAVDHHGASWASVFAARLLGRPAPRRTLVFIEVKTRNSDRWGGPTEAVNLEKQRRVADAAQVYLKANHLQEYPARFDVVAILWTPGENRPRSIQHYKNAFPAPQRWSRGTLTGPVYG